MKAFISTYPFGTASDKPLELLKSNNIEYRLNEHNRKMKTSELASEIKNADILIAGTELIDESVFIQSPNLKFISRVGIGLDNLDFALCKKYNIRVAYTPDAPTIAVAELCVGMIIDLCRKISETNNQMKTGLWNRHIGTLLYGKTVGIIGLGRIGKSLMHLLSAFNVNFLVHEIVFDYALARLHKAQFVGKAELMQMSDIVSVNIPLKENTLNFITRDDLMLMKSTAILINTARGGIVNEEDLFLALKNNIIAAAASDVFVNEPYSGRLLELDNFIATPHIGAATTETRTLMEVQAVEEAIRFKNREPLKNEVFSLD